MEKRIRPKEFPRGFLWGSAAAAHQVEGNNTSSDWWDWEQKGGTSPSGVACDHYHRFEEDFKSAKSLNQNAHRFSIEWARIEPREGEWDKEAVRHYHRVLDSLKANGLTSFMTLHHVTLPLWFSQRGGFENSSNIKYFERFARFCAEEYGRKVDFWATVNEPLNYVWAAYAAGLWPPQKRKGLAAIGVYLNLIRAHNKAYSAIKDILPEAKVGPVLSTTAVHYHGGNPFLSFIARVVEVLHNRSFLLLTRRQFDFIGVNYYFRHDISFKDLSVEVSKKLAEQIILIEGKDHGFTSYPKGIYEVLVKLKKYRRPVYITENGVPDAKDELRKEFIKKHLFWVHRALQEGVDVKGYFYWSLTDNFEWIFGFRPRFGLIEVDYRTQKRTVRKSARFYARVCKENAIPDD